MSEGKFGEPWAYNGEHEFVCDRDGEDIGWCQKQELRAIACVNAFANVEDPAAELARLRRMEAAAEIVVAMHADLSESGDAGLDDEIDALRDEIAELKIYDRIQRLALEAVEWYFDQRRYSVSPVGDGNYYLHDTTHRYANLIKQSDGSWWPSVYAALCAGRQASIDAAREGS